MSETNNDPNEQQERAYIEMVQAKIKAELDENNANVSAKFQDVLEMKRHLQEAKAEMDHAEKISVRQSVEELGSIGAHGAKNSKRLRKLLDSTFFGRVDFRRTNHPEEEPIYIGIHSYYDSAERRYLVHDWRAPVSSMFYDYETGPAQYEAPSGIETGEITRKRQYRIENGQLIFMLETSLNIHDDVLQKELSHNSSEKMKNIVATIQRDQNAIIRNDDSHTLIIQGAAGSGKTSIALHRIAFLLYKFKESIRSSDILIVSPNKVFAHYISNVLPELGEENIQETTMEDLAAELLDHKYPFQTFYEQVSSLLGKKDKKFRERIAFKASLEFLEQLDAYILHLKNSIFTPAPIRLGKRKISAEFVEERAHRLGTSPFAERINELIYAVMEEVERVHQHEIKGAERTSLRKQVSAMFSETKIPALYKGFYSWIEQPAMFKFASRGVYEFADVFPLIYFQMQLEGPKSYDDVKHLVVDEMQDYTPVQYTVLNQLFPCKHTILGDANQAVNPLSSSNAESINAIFLEADRVNMNKSYRSTIEISNLAQSINRNEDLIPIERHGDEPEIIPCENAEAEIQQVRSSIQTFLNSDHRSLGILCKTQEQADALHAQVEDLSDRIYLINPESSVFSEGVTIATTYLAKGLEFDEVILPHCDQETYGEVIDQHMLYVGVTRAMHKLTLTHTGKRSEFLQDPVISQS